MTISPKYRAILCDGIKRERPLQIFGHHMSEIESWAGEVLKTAPEGSGVNVFQTVEQHCKLIPKPQEKA